MHSLFLPAMGLMHRLRFGVKFALSGALGLALLIFFGASQAWTYHQRVQGLAAELAAVDLMKLLVDWNKILIDSRAIVIGAKPGDAEVRSGFNTQAQVLMQAVATFRLEGEARALPASRPPVVATPAPSARPQLPVRAKPAVAITPPLATRKAAAAPQGDDGNWETF